MVEIIEYENKYQPDFKRLNLEWLDKYNLTEEADLIVLDDPVKEVIERGGFIWLAGSGDEIVGTGALMNEGHGAYELAKMCVTLSHQGRGISKMLIDMCLRKAKEINAKKVLLFSNHQLRTALGLYEKYGFVHVEVKNSPFATADVKMELNL